MATEVERDRDYALGEVRRQAAGCQNCPLWEIGTQTVFGVGPASAMLMLIGEAPGYQEDQQGMPFVGPAGRLLDDALAQAGIDREDIYVTNTVKHRPWVPGGRQGKNRPPKQNEINACRPWLEQELAIVRPQIVGCLGAIAAKWILGRDFKLSQQRGRWLSSDVAPHVLATIHPSYVLIQPSDSRDRCRNTFFADLRLIGQKLTELERRAA
ncbi:MAG: UdgX family uracil-DNA binding protein [Chloroflexi bacterium]|nr:UdgX family uracil-DNA binding protein [Chloroflexota bacterium]